MPLKFSQETFDQLELPDLLINIWDYADHAFHNEKNAPAKVILINAL